LESFESFRQNHFKYFVKLKLWIVFIGFISQRLRKSISTLQRGVLGRVVGRIQESIDFDNSTASDKSSASLASNDSSVDESAFNAGMGWRTGTLLYQLPALHSSRSEKPYTRRLVEVLFLYRNVGKDVEFKFLWRKTKQLGTFTPTDLAKAIILENGLKSGIFLIDGPKNFIGFSKSKSLTDFLEKYVMEMDSIHNIDECYDQKWPNFTIEIARKEIVWCSSYDDPIAIFPVIPTPSTEKLFKQTLECMKKFRKNVCCRVSKFYSFGFSDKSLRQFCMGEEDIVVAPQNWKATILFADAIPAGSHFFSPILNRSFGFSGCSCFLNKTIFEARLVKTDWKIKSVLTFIPKKKIIQKTRLVNLNTAVSL